MFRPLALSTDVVAWHRTNSACLLHLIAQICASENFCTNYLHSFSALPAQPGNRRPALCSLYPHSFSHRSTVKSAQS
ncbi:hypothetical protein K458DRAFT_416813 [Lentithecium fluviatile CBS 122367]|uniref:Uncharacterized protein n=1 Tax=Lentithecium fluviatile CBS 122367 TaxID=1168545 RepID=A0A6G1J5Q9_9PLEO|nr:hypothetical protein K458DRAFT_416813 [Lentithecium fluviatile CBS 122367]